MQLLLERKPLHFSDSPLYMSKTLTIIFLFLLGCLFVLMPTNIEARFAINDFVKLNLPQTGCYSGITKEEMELLLKDANPMMLKRLAEDVEMKKVQIKNLRELLATSCQAVKEGLADDYTVKQELKNIEIELIAVNYDREINKNKNPMPPFGFISETLIKEFYKNQGNLADFESYLKIKIQSAKENGQIANDLEPTEEDVKQAKEYFAKTRIYYAEAQRKANELSKEFWDKTAISVKLQIASFLSRIYSKRVLEEKTKVSEAEIQNYIAAHPEYDTKAQKAKAYKILRRIEAGENFAKLAKEFSEDPGSKDQGGLYQKVNTGQFMPEFEKAALSLKVGEIYPNPVETSYGFHIIKLEGKRQVKNEKGEIIWNYDVRHILISTAIKDANNPMSSPVSIKDFVKNKIEEEKQNKLLNEILLNNPIVIAEDFEIPKVTDEQIQNYIQQQNQTLQKVS